MCLSLRVAALPPAPAFPGPTLRDRPVLPAAEQRYVTAIEAAVMVHPDNPPYGVVTASAGASELSQSNCTDVDSALHEADESLYVAKARGRNRLEIHLHHSSIDVYTIGRKRAAS